MLTTEQRLQIKLATKSPATEDFDIEGNEDSLNEALETTDIIHMFKWWANQFCTEAGIPTQPLSSEDEQKYIQLVIDGKKAEVDLTIDTLSIETRARLENTLEVARHARNVLFATNIGLLITEVLRFYPESKAEREDFFQEGLIALDKVINAFEPKRGNKLSTPATRAIRRAILRARNYGRRVIKEGISQSFEQKLRERKQQLGRTLEPADVFALIQESVPQKWRQNEVWTGWQASTKPLRLDQPIPHAESVVDPAPFHEMVTIPTASAADIVMERITAQEVRAIVQRSGLEERELLIVALSFGPSVLLNEYDEIPEQYAQMYEFVSTIVKQYKKPMIHQEIGQVLGLTRAAVWQIYTFKILPKLKSTVNALGLSKDRLHDFIS